VPRDSGPALTAGEKVDRFVASKGRGPHRVSDDELPRLAVLRGASIVLAWHRATALYSEVAPLVGVAPRGMGRLLDLLSETAYDGANHRSPR
jgi:hypothetical protein